MLSRYAYTLGFAAVAVACAIVFAPALLAQPMSQNGQAPLGTRIAEQASRACVYPIGGWTIIDCSNVAAAQSAQLTPWARYVIQCGDDSYFATGDEATDEADSSDGWLPSGAWTDFFTTLDVRYVSCLNKNSDSDCRIIRCM